MDKCSQYMVSIKKWLHKKLQFLTILFPFSSPNIYATSCSLNIIIIRRNIIQQFKKERKRKEQTKQKGKKRRKNRNRKIFSFFLFEAPLVILLRTTTKWLTKRVRPQFILYFLRLLSIIWWLYIPICIYFLLKKQPDNCRICKKNKHGLFLLLSNQFFCPHSLPLFSMKYDQSCPP